MSKYRENIDSIQKIYIYINNQVKSLKCDYMQYRIVIIV